MTERPPCETCGGDRVIDIYICDDYAGKVVCPDCSESVQSCGGSVKRRERP